MGTEPISGRRTAHRLPHSLGPRLTVLVVGLGWTMHAATAQSPPTPVEQQCFAAVQGKVAWNQGGDKAWDDGNVRNLCQGTSDSAATIACFEAEIRVHNSWERAIAACRPTIAVNGHSVTLVDFGQAGNRQGDYRQIGPREWVETTATGSVFAHFDEIGRDDWSVYLADPSRGVNIQLDLHTRKVMYSDASSQERRILSDVVAASAAASAPAAATVAAPSTPPAVMSGGGPIDQSFVVLRCGPVTAAADAASKCTAVCSHAGGFSGNWAVVARPNLAACQCRAQPLADLGVNELVTDVITSNEDASRICPAACAWYGGGNGTWGALNDTSSICGCVERVAP